MNPLPHVGGSGADQPGNLPAADVGRLLAEPVAARMVRECRDCGHFQTVPAMPPGHVAHCLRCDAALRRTRHNTLGRGLALYMTALCLFLICCTQSLMTVGTFGLNHTATLFSGPAGFGQYGIWPLAAVVAFMTIIAPMLRLVLIIYVLIGLRLRHPPVHLRKAFAWADRLRPWAMVDVFLLGLFVAFAELPSQLHTNIGASLYALLALMIVLVTADAVLDREAVWEEMDKRGIPDELTDHEATLAAAAMSGAVACDVCGLVNSPRRGIRLRCPRCGFALEARKPNSITRAWALLIAAAVLYIPANIYPVLAFYELGLGIWSHHHRRCGGAPSCGTLAARTPGVPCQHCCAVPQNPGIGDAVNHHAKAVTLATPPAYRRSTASSA